ncbi:MAG TPA: hypothetical protein VFG43_07325 [Geminicoccaceae bacterium]|nr:hypothetical protein [Geminicoccaceae bacterium]
MHVLILESEALIAFMLESELRIAGHRILGPVPTVEAALGVADGARPDVALITLDHGADGAEAAHGLHERHGCRSLFMSDEQERAHAHRDVAWGFVMKPSDPQTICASLEVIERLRNGQEPEGPLPPQLELFQRPEAPRPDEPAHNGHQNGHHERTWSAGSEALPRNGASRRRRVRRQQMLLAPPF